jgi:hypothetical protein
MRPFKIPALAIATLLASSAIAMADHDVPGADWMPKDQVMQKLQAAGYSSVTGLEADDGHWEGKGVKNGQITEFHIDPHTGVFTKEEIDNH